jgi:hypothetical protein
MTNDELRAAIERGMSELTPTLNDLRGDLAQLGEMVDAARSAGDLDPWSVTLSTSVVRLMEIDVAVLGMVDALAQHALA